MNGFALYRIDCKRISHDCLVGMPSFIRSLEIQSQRHHVSKNDDCLFQVNYQLAQENASVIGELSASTNTFYVSNEKFF